MLVVLTVLWRVINVLIDWFIDNGNTFQNACTPSMYHFKRADDRP